MITHISARRVKLRSPIYLRSVVGEETVFTVPDLGDYSGMITDAWVEKFGLVRMGTVS